MGQPQSRRPQGEIWAVKIYMWISKKWVCISKKPIIIYLGGSCRCQFRIPMVLSQKAQAISLEATLVCIHHRFHLWCDIWLTSRLWQHQLSRLHPKASWKQLIWQECKWDNFGHPGDHENDHWGNKGKRNRFRSML